MNYIGEVITYEAISRVKCVINSVGTCNVSDITDGTKFGLALENEVTVSRVVVSNSTAKTKVDYLTLSKKWGISPDISKKKYRLLLRVVLEFFCICLYL